MLGIFLAILMGALDQFVVLTALPNIATSLGQASGAAFVVSAYLISATVGIPVFGRLADMYSRRDVFLVGLATFVGGSILAVFSQNLSQLILFRAVQGFASNAFIIVGFVIVAALFPPESRARIAGVFTGTFVIATILGPFLGSFIVDHVSWRWVFFLNIPIAVFGFLILRAALTRLTPVRVGRYDLLGTALLVGWVAPLTLAVVQNADAGWAGTDLRTLALLVAAVGFLLAFVAQELREAHPVVPLRLLRQRLMAASGSVSFLRGVTLFSLYTFIAIYTGLVLLHGAAGAADTVRDVLYFLVLPAGFGAGVGSQLMARLPYRTIAGVGLGLAALGTLFLTQVSTSTPLWTFALGFLPIGGLVLPLIPIGLGIGLTFPVTLLAAQFSVAPGEVGGATSIVQFLGTLGGAVGVSLLSSFQQWRFAGLAPSPPLGGCVSPASNTAACAAYAQVIQDAGLQSIQEVFVVILILSVVSLVASLFMTGRMPKGASAPPA